MNETKGGSSKRRKALSATLAVAMALTMLLSGTLAYFYQSFAVNKFDGKQLEKKAIGHDDFNKETGNKDIYVENAGETPIYVRVKLTEDYWDSEQGENTDEATAEARPYNYKPGFVEIDVDEAGTIKRGEMIHTQTGETGDTALGSGTDHQAFHENYFSWTWGTAGKTYLRAGVEGNYGTQEANAETYLKDKVAYDTTNAGNKYTEGDNKIGKTADSDGVLTYGQWVALAAASDGADIDTQITAAKKKYDFTGWILAPDGWYYWSKPVQGKDATGLLLDQVDKQGKVKDDNIDYEYHIHVQFEATNDADVGLWKGTQTESVSGDEWKNSQTVDWSGGEIMLRLCFENKYNVDALLSEIDQLKTNWESKTIEDKDGHVISLTSSAALKMLENAKLGLLKVNDAVGYVNDIEQAKLLQASYEKEKTDAVNGVEGAKDPDEVILDNTKVTDAGVADYLFNSFGNGENLTREQAAAITTIYLNGHDYSHRIFVKDLSWLTAENFPNLKRVQLAFVSFQGIEEINLPNTVTEIKMDCVYGSVNKINVSALKLTEFSLNETTLKKFANSEAEEGIFGLSHSNETLSVCDLRSLNLTSFDASNMPNARRLYFGGRGSQLTTLKLDNLEKLEVLYLDANNLMTELDISMTGLATLNTRGFKALKQITCKEGQKIQNNTGHSVYLKIINSEGAIYKKISSTGIITESTADDFTNPPAEE